MNVICAYKIMSEFFFVDVFFHHSTEELRTVRVARTMTEDIQTTW